MKALNYFLSYTKSNFQKLQHYLSRRRKKVLSYIDTNPFRSFFIFLSLLFVLIVISNVLGNPKTEVKKPVVAVKSVEFYSVGSAPKMKVLAQIEKSGVITITALTPGVVSYINTFLGTHVNKGDNLIGLSTNYQGGNTSSLQRQLAQFQYQNAVDTKDLQQDIITKQKELAQKANVQVSDLRSITDKAVGETQTLIELNSQIITTLDATLQSLEDTNVNGSNDALILSTRQLKTQFMTGINMARQGLRIAEYNASDEKTPAQLTDLQKDVAIKQLELQEKMLDLNLEISKIQLQIARVVEGMMYPGAPFGGTIERIFVDIGQAVNPGSELMVLSGDEQDSIVAVAYVSRDIAGKVSKIEDCIIHVNSTVSFETEPAYITGEAVRGTLYGIYFSLPAEYSTLIAENSYISIDIPIGYYKTGSAIPFIPIDAVYQTKDSDYVYVDTNGTAKSISVELGNVYGSYVEVKKGLQSADKVILSRTIIAGDKVSGKLQ